MGEQEVGEEIEPDHAKGIVISRKEGKFFFIVHIHNATQCETQKTLAARGDSV